MNILYLTYPINGLLMLGLAIGLGVWLTRKFRLPWRLWWIGAATFVLSQVGHIPFNLGLTSLFTQGVLPSPPADFRLIFNAIVLGLSAGLWEELARYATYRWWAKDTRTWGKGLLLGAGHGGIEAIILGVLVLYTFIQMAALQGANLETLVPADQLALAEAQVATYWSSPWYLSLLGAVERFFTLIAHLALSVLVLQAFTRGKSYWLWLAVAWHAFLDAAAVYSAITWGVVWAEVVLAGITILNLGLIFVLRQPEPVEPESEQLAPLPEPGKIPILPEIEITEDSLQDTRYGT
jgi:uncharacterized membrane protein YhfC